MLNPTRIKTLIFSAGLVAIILLNLFTWRNPWLALIVGIIYLFVYGRKLGRVLFAKFDATFQALFGVLAFLCGIIILLSLSYYFYQINDVAIIGVIIIGAIAVELLSSSKVHSLGYEQMEVKTSAPSASNRILNYFLIASFLIVEAACFFLLIHSRTDISLASPWQVVPKQFFFLFFISSALLVWTILINSKTKLSLALTCLHIFLMSSVASIVYKIGYGYDPFLHLAGQKIIEATGTLKPTLFYYIGEYSLAIFLNKLLLIPLDWINKFLVQIMFAIYLPVAIFYGMTLGRKLNERTATLLPLLSVLLPLTFFITTTPQALAALLCLIIIFLSLNADTPILRSMGVRMFMILLAATTCFIHPLLGAPISLYVLYLLINSSNVKASLKKISQTIIIPASLFIFPILFFGYALASGQSLALQLPEALSWHIPTFAQQYNFVYDLIYVYGVSYQWIFLLVAAIAIGLLIYKKRLNEFSAPIIFSAIFIFNYLFIKYFINFRFLSTSQASDYQKRIIELAFYFLLPVFLYGCYSFINKTLSIETKFIHKVFVAVLICLVLSASLYFSYPIKDDYSNSKNFSAGQGDFDAVTFINKTNGDYIVLANQIVAAAAIKEFGFKKYYNGAFYYSIPDGNNNFSQYYLDMLVDPSVTKTEAAMKAAGVNQLYFVVNNYWTNANKIIANAKTTATTWQAFQGGADYVFYYRQ